MIETKSPEINVEELMRNIRQEVLKRKNQLNQSVVSLETVLPSTVIESNQGDIAQKPDYNLADFLDYDDEDFIRNAYRGILRREPDEAGYSSSLSLLRNNPDSKIAILTNLRLSAEGKARAVPVRGFLKTYLDQYKKQGIKSQLHMEPLLITEAEKINLRCIDKPNTLVIGEQYLIKVCLFNGCNRILSSTAPHPINLSYLWEAAENGENGVYERLRTALNKPCLISSDTEYEITVKTPDFVGDYVLKIVVVQEGVRWHKATEQATLGVNVTQYSTPLPIMPTND
jgi:Domain of unknown function (DUF4214)